MWAQRVLAGTLRFFIAGTFVGMLLLGPRMAAAGFDCAETPAGGDCGNVGGTGPKVLMNEFNGPATPGFWDCGGFFCDTALLSSPFFRLADPTCVPLLEECDVDLVVSLWFPGLQQGDCLSNPLVYWTATATPPPCGAFTCPGTVCGTGGNSIFDRDRAETMLQISMTCADLGSHSGVYSLRVRTCPSGCNGMTLLGDLGFPGTPLGEAIGCLPRRPPPRHECGCECRLGASPAGGGASLGPVLDGIGGPALGPGTKLRYRAGGAGHPASPGSAEWRQRLGLYWSHDYAQRIVPDPDEGHVWLITEHATVREFTDGDADGTYETVSPSTEERELTWLDPGWELRDLDGSVLSFDGQGRWLSARDRNGNEKVACYDTAPACDGPGPLISVSMPDGRREDFTYHTTGKLASIREVGVGGSPTRSWSLTWSFANAGDDLIGVGLPDGRALRMLYRVVGRPGYLSLVLLVETPPEGATPDRTLHAWDYDEYGNVIRAWRGATTFASASAVDKWSFAFDDPEEPAETTVTDPLGNTEVFTIGREAGSGVPRIESVAGACPVCSLAGGSQLAYDDPAEPLRPTAIADGEGHVTVLTYGPQGQVVSRTEAADDPTVARTTTWDYHPTFPAFPTLIQRPSVAGATVRASALDYDPVTGDLLSRTESGGEATAPGGTFSLTTNWAYNAAGRVATVDPPGHGAADVTSFTYDPLRGDLLPATRTDPVVGAVASTSFTYDGWNRPTRTLDVHGVATDTQYDALNRVTRTIQRATSPPPADPAAAPGANDLGTTYSYNVYGDLFRTTLPRGSVIEYGYDAAGRLITIERRPNTTARGERLLYTLDGAGNRIREDRQRWTGSAWETVTATAYERSTRCRLDRTIEAPGTAEEAVTEFDYDCNGNAVATWDPTQDSAVDPPTSSVYDALDRLIQVRQPWGGAGGGEAVTDYLYDAQDHFVEVKDPEGNRTVYGWSDRDLRTSEAMSFLAIGAACGPFPDCSQPGCGCSTTRYDEHGEAVESVDPRGVVTNREFDPLDRLKSIAYLPPDEGEPPPPLPFGSSALLAGDRVEPSPSVTYTYDDPAVPFSLGRMTAITRSGVSVEYETDRFGRLIRDGELTYTLDKNGNPTQVVYPGSVTANTTYDFADRPATLAVVDSPNPSRTIVSATAYRPFGPPSSHTLGNGLTETRAHGLRDQPDRITVGTLLDWDYTTDPAGNPTAIADLLVPATSRTFAYQPVQHFLTCAAGPWNPPGADCATAPPAGQPLAWTYDRIGNRLSETRAGASDTYAYAANPCPVPADPDRPCPLHTPLLTQISLGAGGTRLYQHGLAGHLEQVTAGANVVELTSDAEGRLTNLARPSADAQADMAYDGRSFLTRSTEFPPNPGGTLFSDGFETGDAGCWSDAVGGASGPGGGACFSLEAASVTPLYSSEGLLHRLARRPSAGGPETLEYHFSFGGRPIALLSKTGATATWRFLTADHLGTPVLATDLAGALVWRGGFEPFGADWQAGGGQGASENGIHLRLPGQWVDGSWETAGEGVGVYYNVHRWYEVGTGRYSRPDPLGLTAGLNLFQYAKNGALRWTDPLGLKVEVCCAPADIAFGLVDHCWLKTDTVEAGMGNLGGNIPGDQCDLPYIARTQIVDHRGASESRPGAHCHPAGDVDEQCVNEGLQTDSEGLGRETGRFHLGNNCQSFVAETLRRCRSCKDSPQLPAAEFPACAGFGCLQNR